MEKEDRFSLILTKTEAKRCGWFFILWNGKRWLIIFVTAFCAGQVVGGWFRNVWLVTGIAIFLWVAVVLVVGYFNVVRNWVANAQLFEQRDSSSDDGAIAGEGTRPDAALSLPAIRRVVELRDFIVIYGRGPVYFIPKRAASPSQLESLRNMVRRYTKQRSDRFTRWIGRVVFRI
jgi:hypothetical protein